MVQQRLCLTCGAPFEVPPTSKRKFCSTPCDPNRGGGHSRRPKPKVDVECGHCGKTFQQKAWLVAQRTKQGWTLYCSIQCRDAAKMGRRGQPKAQRVTRHCELCGTAFDVPPHQLDRRFCSRSCAAVISGRKGGQPRHGAGNPGERTVTKDGYMLVYVHHDERPVETPQKARYFEHRYVMSKMLGRWPEPNEQVHHINGDKTDNRPENLQLRTGNHGSGHVLRCRCCGSSDIEYVELD